MYLRGLALRVPRRCAAVAELARAPSEFLSSVLAIDVPCLCLEPFSRSSLPPVVVPVVEWRALPAILDPAIAVPPWAGAAPSRSAPSVGSRPTDPDGRTHIGTTEATGVPSILAASGAVRTYFGNRRLRTRRTGFSLGCCCGRSISDLDGRCCAPNTWLSGGRRRRRRRVEDVHTGDVARAQMVSLSGLNVAP